MSLETYSALQTTIATYAFRVGDGEFTAAVPTFIQLAESRMNRRFRLRDQIKVATLTPVSGGADLPADFLEASQVRSLGNPARLLSAVAPSYGNASYPNPAGGDAWYYAIEGDKLVTFPPASQEIELTYYAKIPALGSGTQTNWLLDKAPEIYLYGALMEAQPFMMDDARIATWGTMYEQAALDLERSDTGARFARAGRKVRGSTP
jgi:hypothetical protein